MSFACSVLRWTPKDFWSASLCELEDAALAFVPSDEAPPMPVSGLNKLMARFPDE
ncbi:MAG: hypothetical protein CMI60_15050 [Parvibaculum sp.]|nr:hypothetical protein [Parvibaculum sp.]